MENKTLYPKTSRVGSDKETTFITEKLDGSNLGFYVKDDVLYIAQRNWIFTLDEIMSDTMIETPTHPKKLLYKGLYEFLKVNGEKLKSLIYEGSIVFGEWIGMGQLKYNFDKRYFMFAKARFDERGNVVKIVYELDLLKYAFVDQTIPEFMTTVPLVDIRETYPSIEELDELYTWYSGLVDRNVEGFVLNHQNNIRKYVRMKGGVLIPHKTNVRGDE